MSLQHSVNRVFAGYRNLIVSVLLVKTAIECFAFTFAYSISAYKLAQCKAFGDLNLIV